MEYNVEKKDPILLEYSKNMGFEYDECKAYILNQDEQADKRNYWERKKEKARNKTKFLEYKKLENDAWNSKNLIIKQNQIAGYKLNSIILESPELISKLS